MWRIHKIPSTRRRERETETGTASPGSGVERVIRILHNSLKQGGFNIYLFNTFLWVDRVAGGTGKAVAGGPAVFAICLLVVCILFKSY